jgi:hypothetical protein
MKYKATIQKISLSLMLAMLTGVTGVAQNPEAAPAEETFHLSFPGGPPSKLVEAMEKAGVKNINVLIPPKLAQFNLPRLELRAVTASTIFTALNFVVDQDAKRWFQVKNVWILQDSRREPPDTRVNRVVYIGNLLGKYKVDDITTAIQTAWQLSPAGSKAELKYHSDTQLLIALADKPQLDTIHEVVTELHRGIVPTRIEPSASSDKTVKPPADQRK